MSAVLRARWEADGYLMFRSGIPRSTNRRIVAALSRLPDAPGHDLIEAVPAAWIVLYDPIINLFVRSVLGPDAAADPCRHVHESGPADGPWHADDYCGAPWPDSPRRVILCYYPQDTPPEMGATQVRSLAGDEVLATGPAGTCLLMRHDLIHRATANRTTRRRFMLKFLFAADREAGNG